MSSTGEQGGDGESPGNGAVQPGSATDRPTASRATAIAVAVVAAIVLVLSFGSIGGYILAGCTAVPPPRVIPPRVVDEAGALSPQIIRDIERLRLPEDMPLLVRTVRHIEPASIVERANELMEDDAYWSTVRPRPLLRRLFRQDDPSSTGVFVLASLSPPLLQVRYGSGVRLAAYRAGLACGPWYRSQQDYAPGTLDARLVGLVGNLERELARIERPGWILGKLEWVASLVWAEIEDAITVFDGRIAQTALVWYVKCLAQVHATNSAVAFVLVSLLLYGLLWLGLKRILLERLILPRVTRAAARVGITVTAEGCLLAFLVTGLAVLVVLGRGRAEDEILLAQLGLGGIAHLSLDPAYFAVRGGFLLALPAAVLAFVAEQVEANPPERPDGKTLSLGFVAWSVALFLLPRAIGLVMLPMLSLRFLAAVRSLAAR